MIATTRVLLLFGGIVTGFAGCTPRPDLPPMEKVTGIVMLDGAPVTRGLVQFQPASGPPAVGAIGPDGKYELTTAEVKGAVVGQHTILVDARAEPKDAADTLPKPLIPEKYFQHETSGLRKEVVAGKANEIPIELTSP